MDGPSTEYFCGDWAHLLQHDVSRSPLPPTNTDLQLAAELGKTLLERNKELEAALRHHQNQGEDQAQEIEYLRKQTLALREVNDSRLRIYEALEISIQELESSNHRLTGQTLTDKKHISSLENQVERLESRLEDTTRLLEQKLVVDENRAKKGPVRPPGTKSEDKLREELGAAKSEATKHLLRLRDLQTTVDLVTQENLKLEEELLTMQKKQDELMAAEALRIPAELCARCLRCQETESATGDEDDASVIDSLIADDSYQSYLREAVGDVIEKDNPYRALVEKYEELMKVDAAKPPMRTNTETPKTLSLQEELAMSGEYNSFRKTGTGGELSEAETASSGFPDDSLSTVSTQTEALVPPGAFLCSITDGDDCKFSIYDEASPIETRFRKTPEYRKLFREIFDVLKRAAEAKDEGESLPLLEDLTPVCEGVPKVPPVTPCADDCPQGSGQGRSSESQVQDEKRKRRRRRGINKKFMDLPPSSSPAPRPAWWSAEPSSAAQEVAKLKQLEKSYAEVLRLGRQHANRNEENLKAQKYVRAF